MKRVWCVKLEEVGVGDGIVVSPAACGKADTMIGESHDGFYHQAEGYFHEYGLFGNVDIPVITVGGLTDFDAIEAIANSTGMILLAFTPFVVGAASSETLERG